jgi:hypothetical protein
VEPDLAPGDLPADDEVLDSCCDTHVMPVPLPLSTLYRQRKVEAQIVMCASTLLGLDHQPAYLRGYGAIPAEIAKRIGDTAQINTPPQYGSADCSPTPPTHACCRWKPEPDCSPGRYASSRSSATTPAA